MKDIFDDKESESEGINEAIENVKVVNAFFRFDKSYYFNIISLTSNDKLFLAINENDFIFDQEESKNL